jgi:hypothetical protein
MATLLADSPPAPPTGQAPPGSPNGAHGEDPVAPSQAVQAERSCTRCGSAMALGQDWCVQCGAGAPGSLGTPSWRAAATVIGAVAILVLGAAAAAVAALSKGSAKAPVVTKTVAQVIPPPTTTPATAPTTPSGLATTPAAKTPLPSGTVKPPKIPLSAVTPKASEKTATTPSSQTNTTSTSTTPSSTTTTPTSTTNEESQQAAILLDTNAASTYNPYGYAASGFGDPALAIDGDTSTAWTAQVNPETAPKMAQGLLIDLKAKEKVAVLELITSTPGMTVQVYGANGHTAPASITDPAWVPLSAPKVVKKKHLRLALRDSGKQFTFITLWISKAPPASIGTAAEPGHVAINEVELFEPS